MCTWWAQYLLQDWMQRLLAHLGLLAGREVNQPRQPTVFVSGTSSRKVGLHPGGRRRWRHRRRLAGARATTPPLDSELSRAGSAPHDSFLEAHGERADGSDAEPDEGASRPLAGGAGAGPPIMVGRGMRRMGLCDGLGCCSPGRWASSQRRIQGGTAAQELDRCILDVSNNLVSTSGREPGHWLAMMATHKLTSPPPSPFSRDRTEVLRGLPRTR